MLCSRALGFSGVLTVLLIACNDRPADEQVAREELIDRYHAILIQVGEPRLWHTSDGFQVIAVRSHLGIIERPAGKTAGSGHHRVKTLIPDAGGVSLELTQPFDPAHSAGAWIDERRTEGFQRLIPLGDRHVIGVVARAHPDTDPALIDHLYAVVVP